MNAEAPLEPQWNAAHDRIRTILTQARLRAWQAVNVEMGAAYWEFGKGFDRSNLWNMWAFYFLFPILDALRRELSGPTTACSCASRTPPPAFVWVID